MDAAREVIYECDLSNLPKDKKFICFKEVEEYKRVVYIQKNLYRVAVLEDEYGVRSDYFVPIDKADSHRPYANVAKGTHATPEWGSCHQPFPASAACISGTDPHVQ